MMGALHLSGVVRAYGRYPRRRPARPHARAGRRPAWLALSGRRQRGRCVCCADRAAYAGGLARLRKAREFRATRRCRHLRFRERACANRGLADPTHEGVSESSRAGDLPGPARREKPVSRDWSRYAGVRRGRQPRRPRCGDHRHRFASGAKNAPSRLRRQGPSGAALARRRRCGVECARRRAIDTGSVRAVYPRGLDHRGTFAHRGIPPLPIDPQLACQRHSGGEPCARPANGPDRGQRCRACASGGRTARLCRDLRARTVRSGRPPSRQRDSAARAQLWPLDYRRRAL